MKLTKLKVLLMAPTALAMFLALTGCAFDHHDHDRDHDGDRMPDRERHDGDRPGDHRDNDRPDEGGRHM